MYDGGEKTIYSLEAARFCSLLGLLNVVQYWEGNGVLVRQIHISCTENFKLTSQKRVSMYIVQKKLNFVKYSLCNTKITQNP